MPTKKPASAPSTPIKNRGKDGCNDGKCKLCEGDCDRDSDCKNGLRCFLREGLEPVPGCSGDGHGGESFGSQGESCSDHRVCPISSSSLITTLCGIVSNILFCIRIICSLGLLHLRSLRGVYSPIRRPWHFLKKHAYMHLHCLSLVNYRDQGTVLKFNLVPFWKEVSCCSGKQISEKPKCGQL